MPPFSPSVIFLLTHWGIVTQICVIKFTIIGSDNGLSPIRRQAIIWTNAVILLIPTLGTNFSEILIQIHTFSNKKMHLKMSSGKCRPFCLGLNVLTMFQNIMIITITFQVFAWNMEPNFPSMTSVKIALSAITVTRLVIQPVCHVPDIG